MTYSEYNDNLVPKWVRIAVGLLALLTIAFGAMGYFSSGPLFGNESVNTSLGWITRAMYEFSARNMAIGIVMGLVSAKGVPESIAALTIVRALVELQTIVITVTSSDFTGAILPVVLLIIEAVVIKTMFDVIQKRDKENKG